MGYKSADYECRITLVNLIIPMLDEHTYGISMFLHIVEEYSEIKDELSPDVARIIEEASRIKPDWPEQKWVAELKRIVEKFQTLDM